MSDNSDCNCDQALRLQAEVETTEQLKMLYKNQLFEAEARIAELEESHFNAVQYQNDLLKIIETQGQLLNGRTEASIKAEGIREMLEYLRSREPDGWIGSIDNNIVNYADKLEKGDG